MATFEGKGLAQLFLVNQYEGLRARDRSRAAPQSTTNYIPFQTTAILQIYKAIGSYKQDREVLMVTKEADSSVFGVREYKEKEKETINDIIRQCRASQSLDAINFLLMTEIFRKDELTYTISPFLDLTVDDLIANTLYNQAGSTLINHSHMISIIKQTLNGLRFLASKNLQHQDLSARNLFLGVHGNLAGILKIGGLESVVKLESYKPLLILEPLKEIATNILGKEQDRCMICKTGCIEARMIINNIKDVLERHVGGVDHAEADTEPPSAKTERLIKSLDKMLGESAGGNLCIVVRVASKDVHYDLIKPEQSRLYHVLKDV